MTKLTVLNIAAFMRDYLSGKMTEWSVARSGWPRLHARSLGRPSLINCRSIGFRGDAEHDVKLGGQLAGARPGDGGEIGLDRLALLRVADAVEGAVAGVARMALDVELRREQL